MNIVVLHFTSAPDPRSSSLKEEPRIATSDSLRSGAAEKRQKSGRKAAKRMKRHHQKRWYHRQKKGMCDLVPYTEASLFSGSFVRDKEHESGDDQYIPVRFSRANKTSGLCCDGVWSSPPPLPLPTLTLCSGNRLGTSNKTPKSAASPLHYYQVRPLRLLVLQIMFVYKVYHSSRKAAN